MPGPEGISTWVVQALPEDFVERLLYRRHDRLTIVNRDHNALQKEKCADSGDQRWHAEADRDDSVDRADQHAEHKPGNRSDGQRHAPGNGHKGHDVRSEREGAADGKINLAGDHQHDFGDGDQAEATGVAKDDAQKLGGQKLPVAAKLEVDYEKDRDDSDAGLSITGENDQ